MTAIKYIMMSLSLLLMVGAGHAESVAAPVADVPNNLSKSARYFDGKQWREVWVSEDEVAEFLPSANAKSKIGSTMPGATLLRPGKRVQIWRLDGLSNAATLNRNIKRGVESDAATRPTYSPVFHRSVNGGPKMALGGSVIVRFKSDWTEEMVAAWAADNGLGSQRVLNAGSRTYVFTAGAGMASLERANAIQESGEVEFAMPQWWRSVYKK